MKAAIGWLVRHAAVYLLLVLAIAFFTFVWPSLREGWSEDVLSPQALQAQLAEARTSAQASLEDRASAARNYTADAREARLAAARRELQEAQQAYDQGGLFASIRPSIILARQKARLRASVLEGEIAALEAAGREDLAQAAFAEAQRRAAPYRRIPTQGAIAAAERQCRTATARWNAFEMRNAIDQAARDVFLDERDRLQNAQETSCAQARALQQRRTAGLALARAQRDARERLQALRDWSPGEVVAVEAPQSGTLLREILVKALIALLLVIATPYLIRILFYYALAPMAERRPAIRLAVPGGRGPAPAHDGQSRASISITLRAQEELLVRQGFLQSLSQGGDKATRPLLDWRHPLSSLASGMAFLTQIRGAGQRTTVSAVADPFAELTELTLAEGSSLVLQPRSLAAVAQPVARPMRITSHWRLFSLNAWLTLQLRYLVFHGPARLVLTGGRGVRVEQAEEGRIFGQDQLVGFSADAAYSVARNETFWPYLTGREPLLRDRITGGGGVLVIEEAPLANRRGGAIRGGLEGAFDAILKAFGL